MSQVIKKRPEKATIISGFKVATLFFVGLIWNLSNFPNIYSALKNPVALRGILICSIFTTALTDFLEAQIFRKVSATDLAFIMSSQPVWVSLVSYFHFGEKLSSVGIIGAFLIIISGLVQQLDVEKVIKTTNWRKWKQFFKCH